MLETIREYALELLAASGEGEAAREAHATYFLDLAELAAPELRGPHYAAWQAQLLAEHDNLRAALSWLAEHGDHERFARLCVGLWRFWWSASFWQEGRQWLDRALGMLPEKESVEVILQTQLLLGAGWLWVGTSDFAGAEQLLNHSRILIDGAANPQHEADTYFALARAAYGQSNAVQAYEYMHAAFNAYRAVGDHYNAVETAEELGYLRYHLGDLTGARETGEEALALARALGHRRVAANALAQLGHLAMLRGEHALAEELLTEGLMVQRQVGDAHAISSGLNSLGELASQQGNYAQAETYWAEALELRQSIGDRRGASAMLLNLAGVAIAYGAHAQAAARCQEGLALARDLAYLQGIADGLFTAAMLSAATNRYAESAHLLGAAANLRETYQLIIWPEHEDAHIQLLDSIRVSLGEDGLAAALAIGAELTLEAALALTRVAVLQDGS
jgi:tetratricopeptide (TPR) repeat protein